MRQCDHMTFCVLNIAEILSCIYKKRMKSALISFLVLQVSNEPFNYSDAIRLPNAIEFNFVSDVSARDTSTMGTLAPMIMPAEGAFAM